ncbi:hypothetical protein GCM10010275_30080 [Streptomyces litmocidini]|uniref:hypothetical protein n=1 Tax=Streptomyces litmocidini TaxID=67318 RepID=UPI00167E0539|nr:hypothetical protein [Streptomyces litmocidini]GGU91034.1 hypothetical protein GCM10010275_30080 [Streptomyces litmocidini]
MTDKADVYLAAALWFIVLAAALDSLLGNETAINGVIGAGIPALVVTAFAAGHRLRRR